MTTATKTVKGIVVTTDGRTEIRNIEPNLSGLQAIVAGHIEGIAIDGEKYPGATVLVNEKGRLKPLPRNPKANFVLAALGAGGHDILGDMVIVGHDEDGNTINVPRSVADKLASTLTFVIADEEVIEAMIQYGGGFVSALGTAWMKADGDNRAKLREAFDGYWDEYTDTVREEKRRKAVASVGE